MSPPSGFRRKNLGLSDEYARQTPYRQRMVFGALGAAWREFELPEHSCVGRMEAEFHLPMCLDAGRAEAGARGQQRCQLR